jgi:hypothetical protein
MIGFSLNENGIIRGVGVAGVTIAIALVGSRLVFSISHYHTDWCEGAWGVVVASSWLVLLWTVVGSVIAAACWKVTTLAFRIVLVFNIGVAGLLVTDFLQNH